METLLKSLLVSAPFFIVMDLLWFSLFMKQFFLEKLPHLARLENGVFSANLSAALVVYVAMGLAVAFFVLPQSHTLSQALGYGALIGLVTYTVFDFTNVAILNQYSISFAIIDIIWGTLLMACGAALTYWILSLWR